MEVSDPTITNEAEVGHSRRATSERSRIFREWGSLNRKASPFIELIDPPKGRREKIVYDAFVLSLVVLEITGLAEVASVAVLVLRLIV